MERHYNKKKNRKMINNNGRLNCKDFTNHGPNAILKN
jgi:hypothetical protein